MRWTLRAKEVESDVRRILEQVRVAGGTAIDVIVELAVILQRVRSDDRLKVARMIIKAFNPPKELARALRLAIDPVGVARQAKRSEREKRQRRRVKSSRRLTPLQLGRRARCRYGARAYETGALAPK